MVEKEEFLSFPERLFEDNPIIVEVDGKEYPGNLEVLSGSKEGVVWKGYYEKGEEKIDFEFIDPKLDSVYVKVSVTKVILTG